MRPAWNCESERSLLGLCSELSPVYGWENQTDVPFSSSHRASEGAGSWAVLGTLP